MGMDRNGRRHQVEALVAEHLPVMKNIVEHHRTSGPVSTVDLTETTRTLKKAVVVMVWAEADGTETLSVVGDADAEMLELKGILHDGLYAIAHADEPGYNDLR